ncbi:MAG: NAD-dependent epimerase/dehydratase family protein [Actinomycetota bacterium]|nr:NAD-dependent epimerase/dehydratase family protein [Actinomycetota bacterium]
MRAVVTGGAGFIGSALVDRLVERGDDVLVIDDLSTGSEDNLVNARLIGPGKVEFALIDIGDGGTADLVAGYRPEVVFHLAAQINVRHSVDDPVADAYTNVIGLLRVLEGSWSGGARKVVFASSGGTIYGEVNPKLLPLDEGVSWRPMSPYGVAKLAGGLYLDVYRKLRGLAGTTLALANVYGPRQDPHGEAGVVAIFATHLVSGRPCTVFGSGEQTRDFVYVGDVVEAFVAAADCADGQLLNIGTGIETSINELYRAMATITGGPEEPRRGSARLGELDRSSLDSAQAAANLGWRPTTSLSEGLPATLEWFANRC